jgi:hypothetical protein
VIDPEHFAPTAWRLVAALNPKENQMTTTDKPLDLDQIRRYLTQCDLGDVVALADIAENLIEEVKRLRDQNDADSPTPELRQALLDAVDHLERHGLPGFNRDNIGQFYRWKTLAQGGDES